MRRPDKAKNIVKYLAWCCTPARGVEKNTTRGAKARPQPVVQTKLTIGAPGDKYEQEADKMAERVVSREVAPLQRQGLPEKEERSASANPVLQRQEQPSKGEVKAREEKTVLKFKYTDDFWFDRAKALHKAVVEPVRSSQKEQASRLYERSFQHFRIIDKFYGIPKKELLNREFEYHIVHTPEGGIISVKLHAPQIKNEVSMEQAQEEAKDQKSLFDELKEKISNSYPKDRKQWMQVAILLKMLDGKGGMPKTSLESLYLQLINQALSNAPSHHRVQKNVNTISSRSGNYEDGKLYFDFSASGDDVGIHYHICEIGRNVRKLMDAGDTCKKENIVGTSIIITKKIIHDTPENVQGCVLHELTHRRQAQSGLSMSSSDEEVQAISESFVYIYDYSDSELKSILHYYLNNYINASEIYREKSRTMISEHLKEKVGQGKRSLSDLEKSVKEFRSIYRKEIQQNASPGVRQRWETYNEFFNIFIEEIKNLKKKSP